MVRGPQSGRGQSAPMPLPPPALSPPPMPLPPVPYPGRPNPSVGAAVEGPLLTGLMVTVFPGGSSCGSAGIGSGCATAGAGAGAGAEATTWTGLGEAADRGVVRWRTTRRRDETLI